MSLGYRKRWNHQTGESYVPGHGQPRQLARSALPRPMLIRDFQDDLRSPIDGRYYGSKKQWRDHAKAHGMVELGNDMPAGPDPTPAITEADIATAYEQCEAGKGVKAPERLPDGWQGDPEAISLGD